MGCDGCGVGGEPPRSRVPDDLRAAVTVIEIVSEAHHAVGHGLVVADPPGAIGAPGSRDRLDGFGAPGAAEDFDSGLAEVNCEVAKGLLRGAG